MTNRATRIRLRLRDADGFADAGRARVEQNSVSPSMKILLRPGDILAPLFTRATVTTGRSASNRANELSASLGSLGWVFRGNGNN